MSKKLIEVALPLEQINSAADVENNPFIKGHPKGLHKWWARRTLGSCRAIIFSSIVDDPGERLPPDEAEAERGRLLDLTARLADWQASEETLEEARREIRAATGGEVPLLIDPFAGGGTIPLEAARLGLRVQASDLNPVAVLLNMVMLQLVPSVAGGPPRLAPETTWKGSWEGPAGFAADVEEAGRRVLARVAPAASRAYGPLRGRAWIWVRTIECPNPACMTQVPLAKTFVLSSKTQPSWVATPTYSARDVAFEVGQDASPPATIGAGGATCGRCRSSISFSDIRALGASGRMGARPIAVATTDARQPYRALTAADRQALTDIPDVTFPDAPLPTKALGFRVQKYGLVNYRQFFTTRQAYLLGLIADQIGPVVSEFIADDTTYALALKTALALSLSRLTEYSNNLCSWDAGSGMIRRLFDGGTVSMTWDFAETNVVDGQVNWSSAVGWVAGAISKLRGVTGESVVLLEDARSAVKRDAVAMFSTDPPYYRNVGYADLSDFFYLWLRRCLRDDYPDVFSTLLTPKSAEIISSPERFDGDGQAADRNFEDGLREVFAGMRESADVRFPVTIHYALKQQEISTKPGETASTGWERMLQALVDADFAVTGTWPVATEQRSRRRARDSNALESSIVLVCRPRDSERRVTNKIGLMTALREELPVAVRRLQDANIAAVDLAQSAIGPGMSVFSRYHRVLEPDGAMTVRTALGLINQVLDEVLSEQEAEFDPDTRWAITWFELHGMQDGPFGDADTLSKAKGTSVGGLVSAGIVKSGGSRVRLLRRNELGVDWDPALDRRMPVWEITLRLIGALLDGGGEMEVADLVAKLGGLGDLARDLAYRLYLVCDRNKWTEDALAYNALVVAWPEIVRLAAGRPGGPSTQISLNLGG